MSTEHIETICEKLTDRLMESLEDPETADTKEVGLVVDMIKDLTEAKEKTMKAAYYNEITEAMKAGTVTGKLDLIK